MRLSCRTSGDAGGAEPRPTAPRLRGQLRGGGSDRPGRRLCRPCGCGREADSTAPDPPAGCVGAGDTRHSDTHCRRTLPDGPMTGPRSPPRIGHTTPRIQRIRFHVALGRLDPLNCDWECQASTEHDSSTMYRSWTGPLQASHPAAGRQPCMPGGQGSTPTPLYRGAASLMSRCICCLRAFGVRCRRDSSRIQAASSPVESVETK